jgi:DNA polymerase V
MKHTYIAIDLKSFYASVECKERKLNPLTTHLVVADESRTEKTICLAVSPSLKAYGIPGRARLYEVISKVNEINRNRQKYAYHHQFIDKSYNDLAIKRNKNIALSFIIAKPRMSLYIDYSTQIYNIYLKYIAPEDIHVYSIDEVFIDVTSYLKTYQMTAYELAKKIIQDIYHTTNITATAGIGTNLYLCKVAMDIVAKNIESDENGVRIASLDEISYRKLLWNHTPITDFWRVGKGYAKRLEKLGLYTMGDIARCSVGNEKDYYNEELLYKTFGVNAELLIDHAWGYEPCTIKDIKEYKPQAKSLGTGQVLHCPYDYQKAKIVIKEMIESLVLDLVDKNLVTDQIVLTVGYDITNLSNHYNGQVTTDMYGRKIPKHAHGTANMKFPTSSLKLISYEVIRLYDSIINKKLFIRRINISANHLQSLYEVKDKPVYEQLDLFTCQNIDENKNEKEELEEELRLQKTIIDIKKKFGKNSILKVMDLQKGATTKDRNKEIGGHKA